MMKREDFKTEQDWKAICRFMGWRSTPTLTLDSLRHVEEWLTLAQCSFYDRELTNAILATRPKPKMWYGWHASVDQKVRALATVIRQTNSAMKEAKRG